MDSTIDFKNNDDLAFFGKVNASISHELKNILAIISEAAGLLNDLTDMASKGGNFEVEMIQTCSKDIVEEIQRGFATIKKMNTFSHSADDPLKRVNLVEVLGIRAGDDRHGEAAVKGGDALRHALEDPHAAAQQLRVADVAPGS